MPSQTADDALLARLNALRRSHVSLDKNAEPNMGNDERPNINSDVVTARGQASTNTGSHNEEDNKLLDELLNDVGLQEEWDLNRHEERDVRRLAVEVQAALPSVTKSSGLKEGDAGNTHSGELSNMFRSDENDEPLSEEQEAQEVIARIMAEVELEQGHEEQHEERQSEATELHDDKKDKDTEVPFELPSAPSTAPETADEPAENEDALAARFSRLSLPAAPSFSPTKKPVRVTKSNLPTFTDEQIETWCVICNDDGEVRCLGCDGDIYCRSCWREGHTGPDAGFDEKQHRWTKYQSKKGTGL